MLDKWIWFARTYNDAIRYDIREESEVPLRLSIICFVP